MTATENGERSPWELLQKTGFTVGGADQLGDLRRRYPTRPNDDDEETSKRFAREWGAFLADLRIRVGTLLKTDSVSFLLGAGVSVDCGGLLMGKVPVEIERDLLAAGVSSGPRPRVRPWLVAFYAAIASVSGGTAVPYWPSRHWILSRHKQINGAEPDALKASYELALSTLHRWHASIPKGCTRITLDGTKNIALNAEPLADALKEATNALARRCQLPVSGKDTTDPLAFNAMLRKVLTRPLNLRRANIFTLNYDTLVERAADAEGIVLLDGFVGALRRVFRPESFDQDLYFPGETTEGRVHRRDRVLHLYKLHGSLNWSADEPTWESPFGITSWPHARLDAGRVLIYPTPAKYGESLGLPYSELFRRFASAVVRPQSTLFVLGYSFGDDHVTAILRQALANSSFTLVIVDPFPASTVVDTLVRQADQRVWVLSGETLGFFAGFVSRALPDLRDEDIQKRVIETVNALRPPRREDQGGTDA